MRTTTRLLTLLIAVPLFAASSALADEVASDI